MSSIKLIAELEYEKVSTKKLLDRLPEDKLTWQPHKKAMTLGQLALHVAMIPGRIATFADDGTVTAAILVEHPSPSNKGDILQSFDQSMEKALGILNGADAAWDEKTWTCTLNHKEIIRWPRPVLLRFLMFNHLYHHRGQLTTYLRILNVDIPSIYGPSADENPFV